jgi:hypothetical protein
LDPTVAWHMVDDAGMCRSAEYTLSHHPFLSPESLTLPPLSQPPGPEGNDTRPSAAYLVP